MIFKLLISILNSCVTTFFIFKQTKSKEVLPYLIMFLTPVILLIDYQETTKEGIYCIVAAILAFLIIYYHTNNLIDSINISVRWIILKLISFYLLASIYYMATRTMTDITTLGFQIAALVFYTILCGITLYIHKLYPRYTNSRTEVSYSLLLLSVCLILEYLNELFLTNPSIVSRIICIIIVEFLTMNGFMYLLSRHIQQEQNYQYEIKLAKDELESYATINTYIDQSSKFKHDLKNTLSLVMASMDNAHYDDAKEVIKQHISLLDNIPTIIATQNRAINAVVNLKLYEAHTKGIKISCIIETSQLILDDYECSSVLGNLLDNAIEYCEKHQITQISLSIFEKQNHSIITVSNEIEASVLQNNKNLVSSKNAKDHGHGVSSIRNVISKYNGELLFKEEQNVFKATIVLPKNEE